MPKGVMWRQDDLFNVLGAGGNPVLGVPPAADVAELVSRIDTSAPAPVMVVACPLMHGTGQFSALNSMASGGTIVSLANRKFDVEELLGAIERHRASHLIIVGQAFAGPILDHLEANPGRFDLSSLVLIVSSGVMWSQENKDGLLRHIPQVILFDSFGSSEAVGLGGVHRRRAPCRPRFRRDGSRVGRRVHPARLLQGRGEDRVDVPHVRGPSLERPG
jgi:fatty-acyl-CoA synthase